MRCTTQPLATPRACRTWWHPSWLRSWSESDTFWCFVGLMQNTIFVSSPRDEDMEKQLVRSSQMCVAWLLWVTKQWESQGGLLIDCGGA